MKKKLILLAVLVTLGLQACTLNVWKYQHWDFSRNVPVYKLVASLRNGPALPVFNYYDVTRQQTPK